MNSTSDRKRRRSDYELVGRSAWTQRIQGEIRSVAPHPSSVLITGPSGSGKELVARAIHTQSSRAEQPFIAINCAAVNGTLFESQMFGHLKGAFTGASFPALGCFRAADGGTIFLDEIGDLHLDLQAKLLRVLQEQTVIPVGSHEEHNIDVRVLAATNRDICREVTERKFREDLYFRLAVVTLHTVSLRERKDDLDVLSEYLLTQLCVRHGTAYKPLVPEALQRLMAYDWPGNVRELQNVLERAVMMAAEDVIKAEDVVFEAPQWPDLKWPSEIDVVEEVRGAETDEDTDESDSKASSDSVDDLRHPGLVGGRWLSLDEIERWHIRMTLEHTHYNQSAAARLLEMDRNVLRRRMKKLGLEIAQHLIDPPNQVD